MHNTKYLFPFFSAFKKQHTTFRKRTLIQMLKKIQTDAAYYQFVVSRKRSQICAKLFHHRYFFLHNPFLTQKNKIVLT